MFKSAFYALLALMAITTVTLIYEPWSLQATSPQDNEITVFYDPA